LAKNTCIFLEKQVKKQLRGVILLYTMKRNLKGNTGTFVTHLGRHPELSILLENLLMLFKTAINRYQRSFVLLAPEDELPESASGDITCSAQTYSQFLSELQRLRGRIYLADGAVDRNQLDESDRHVQPADRKSWHLLTLGSFGRLLGCTRIRRHSIHASWGQLGVRDAPIAQSNEWGFRFRASVGAEIAAARRAGLSYVEVGGWALAKEIRNTTMALRTVLATYAWSQLRGGALGITTATYRNDSAGILRRLGGQPLMWDGAELPSYYDSRYGCEMEVLRFDSREPNLRYQAILDEVREQIATAPIICSGKAGENRYGTRLSQPFPLFEAEVAC
jgi:hypothetical protein